MNISKKEIWFLIQLVLIWTFINLTFNMFGLWFTKLLKPVEFTYLDNIIYEFVRPLAIQSLVFGICSAVTYLFLKNKKVALYSFVAFQFLVFHVIFFLNIKIHHGMHFVSTFHNPGLQYLSLSGQYLVDILYLYFPVNGKFDNSLFMPDNIGTFYIHWIFLNIVYYFGLTWVTIKAVKYFFEEKKEIKQVMEDIIERKED